MGPHATGGQCFLRRLLSSLRHVCLFFPVRARPGLRVLLPHILGTNLRFALGDGCAPSLPTRTVRPHREEETPEPSTSQLASPAPHRRSLSSPRSRAWCPVFSPLSSPRRLLPFLQPGCRRRFSTTLRLRANNETAALLFKTDQRPEL